MNPKTQKRLEAIVRSLDEGAIQPEELMEAIDAVMDVLKQSQDAVFSKIDTIDNATKATIEKLNRELTTALNTLSNQTKTIDAGSKESVRKLKNEIKSELQRVVALIPSLPKEFDATDIFNSITEHKVLIGNLSELIVGENIRNALEALPEGEKLSQDAIEGLTKALEDIKKLKNSKNDSWLHALNGWDNGSATMYNKLTVSESEPYNPAQNDLWVEIT